MSLFARLRGAWAAFIGRTITAEHAEARRIIGDLTRAFKLMGLPMAILDEIAHLDTVIANVVAAAGGDATALATATATVTDLTGQVASANANAASLQAELNQATTAIQALEAKYTPSA